MFCHWIPGGRDQHCSLHIPCLQGYPSDTPHLCFCPALLCVTCRIQHLDFLNFIPLIISQWFNLSRFLCRASRPLRESTTPSSLISSANLLTVHSTPASKWLINILTRNGPKIEPWGTLRVISHHSYIAPFTRTLWALLFSQHTTNPLNPQLDSLSRRNSCVRDSIKSLTKVQKNYIHHLPFIH